MQFDINLTPEVNESPQHLLLQLSTRGGCQAGLHAPERLRCRGADHTWDCCGGRRGVARQTRVGKGTVNRQMHPMWWLFHSSCTPDSGPTPRVLSVLLQIHIRRERLVGMPTFELSPGVSLQYELAPDRAEMYASPTIRHLRQRGVWFEPGVFSNLTELVSLVGGLGSLLQIHESLVKVASGRTSGDEPAAKQIFDLLLKDASESGEDPLLPTPGEPVDTESDEAGEDSLLPPGLRVVNSESDEGFRVEFDRNHLRTRIRASIDGILVKSQQVLSLEDALQAQLTTSLPFVARGDLYVCACGFASRGRIDPCELCGGTLDPNPKVMPEDEPHIRRLIEQDIWLELAIENLFVQRGFRTVVGAKWKGMSGLDHELDVVAKLDGMFTVGVEVCSTGADMDEISKLLIRREEFPFQHFVLVTLGPSTQRAADFARFHNLAVFPKIRENVDKLSDWIATVQQRHGSVTH
jgi:hypothetical protein